MAEHLIKLCQFFNDYKSLPTDLSQKLCSGDALFNHGFQQFYLILKTGLQLIGDDNLGFQSWTDSQIDAVVSLGTAIASVSRSLSVEQVDPIISAVVHQLLEFAVCYLEKSKLTTDDLIIQNNVAHLLEILLVEGLDKAFEPLSHSSINLLSDLLPMLYSDHDGLGLDNHIKCNFQEVCCSSKDKHVDGLLMTLTSECMQSDCQASGFSGIAFRKDLVFTSQHWAVVNVGCIKRLIMCCQKLFELLDMLDEKMAPKNIHKILSFVIRILKLLGSVTKDVQYIGYDMSLLRAFASLTDKFPTLFRLQFDFVNNVVAAEGSVDTLALLLLEEFFHLVRVIFGNSTIFQNIQVCMVASMLASLQTSTWKNSKSAATLNQPLAYFPRIVIYVFKAIQDLKRQTYITLDWQKFDSELDGSHADLLENPPSSMAHFSEVPLLKKFDTEELSKVLFPSSSPWMDDLMHLLVFLLSEAVKSGFKVEKYSSTSKANCILESENSAFHEDEALFGNLFSEGGRSVGSTDGYEQSVASSSSGNYNQSIQAVTELLNFLKACIFSNEWLPSVYKNGCKHLSTDHIDILLSILSCRGYGSEYKSSDNCATLPWGVQELSFELLHNLITSHGLSELLEEYLVDRILDVEKGVFICNDLTLTLLAHTLFCRTGLDGCKLRTKVYQVFVTFVMEKAISVCAGCLNVKELIGTLPSVFHIEILLMVFHLSNEEEKLSLARLICSSLHKIDTPTLDCCSGQLSCWALLISRLILLARHMLFFPDACPSWLLLDLQSKLRGAPLSASLIPNALNYHFISWVSVALKSIMGLRVEEEADMNILINQLIDVVALVPPIIGDGGINSLSSIWNDMISTFSRILGFWNHKKAVGVEDLIIERYIFSLCLDIPSISLSSSPQVFLRSEFHTCDLSDMANFFDFRNSLLGFSDAGDIGINYADYLVGILQRLCEEHIAEDVEHLGWRFLRNGLWLSMVLSLLRVGIHKYCMRQSIPSIDSLQMENIPNGCINVAEGLISSILQGGKIAVLLRTLSVLLSRYLKSYQQAFIATLEDEHCNGDRFSLLLLKHARFDKSLQDELFDKSSDTSWKLASVFDPLTRLDATAEKKASGIFGKVFWESMLHGFPSHTRTPSGILLSSVLSIGGIISVFDGLLRLEDLRSEKYLEGEVLSQTLDSLMTVKFDRIFENLGEKCDAVYRNLNFGLALSDYTNLYLLKQMEEILRGIIAGNVSSKSVVEWVITVFVDIMDNLKKDDPTSVTLKFYLGAEDLPEGVKESCSLLYGDLLVLIDAVDGCYSELANVKVLNFFVDLLSREKFSNLKQKMRNKFLNMDVHAMSKWLEKRLLGSVAEVSSDTNCTNGNSLSLRESTMNFVVCLSSSPPEMLSRELQYHLFEALLVSLDIAFSQFDVHIAKSYFYFAVQLSKTENSIKLLLKRTVMIMEKMVVEEHLLPSLQFLFGFFGTLLDESRSCKDTSEEASGKSISSNSARMDSMPSAPVEPRKNSETLVLSANEGGSISLDCDATSADEDDDYGTSDGEVASLEKEEEDDMDSERALASKVCTFTSSGSNFMEQHWYFCYTCDLTVSKGCCSVCAKVCHRGHRVVYSRLSRFFCDCGAGGVRGSNCQCLKARKFSGNDNAPERGNFQSFFNFSEDAEPESDSDLGEDGNVDAEHSLGSSIPKELQDGIPRLLQDLDLEGQVLELCNSLLHSVTTTRESNMTKDKEIILGEDKVVCYGADVLQLKKAYKSGSLDLKIKADYSNTKDLKSHLVSGSLVKSLLSVSIRGRLAVGEGDKVAIFDAGQLIGQATVAPVTADKTNVKPLSRNVVRFEIVHLCFNPVVESYLAVAGYEDCQVLTFNPRGEVTDRIAIELALQGAYIRRINWIPSSQVQLMVVTNKFIKIYDLSQDNISPVHYFTLPDDMIVDATLIAASKGRMFLIVLSEHGNLFRLGMSVEGNVGATPLKEVIRIQDREMHAKGASLFFSPTYKLLFLSYQDGTTLMGQLSSDATFLDEISCIYEEQDGKMRAAALHYWNELVAGSGLFACFSGIKSNTAVALSMGAHKFLAQNLKHTVGAASHLVGITAYKPLSKEKVDCLALYDDGSLHIYSYVHPGVESGASATVEKAKKLSPDILNNKAYNGAKPEFPLEFFEKTFGITSDVKLGGDAIRNGDFEAAKQSLASEDGFLESPSASGFKVSVVNSNPDIVMVGFRLHVGSTSANHIPSEISIFQRVIRLDEGMRSWYDVPFTVTESLLADEEFVISIGPTFNRSALPRVDALEVYGRAKDEFGWKEKIDAVLDMEARVLGCNSILSASRKKCRLVQSASIQEQVVAAGFKLLSRFYSMCRLEEEEIKAKMSKLRCKQLLETVFECDSEPLLQAAACHVLQAVFPRKEMYYQVKDTMRLAGVVKSVAVLTSRLGGGGVAGGWIIEEFTAQMRAISKIAVHRRSNLALFLEMNGSEIVDGLMKVLWGILESELPDTQIMNNIVVSSVELIYSYAECLALNKRDSEGNSVAPAVVLLKKLLFFPNDAVQASSSLAISSRLLQVPFPKQTMLVTDDSIDGTVTASVPAEPTRRNIQVMGEEDSMTSSVQYSCDGCFTVPIIRRRWHCTICPDFDLCEACYQVLDADRLPPPHSRDHPMTAISIEIDSLGDSNSVNYPTDGASNSSLVPVTADVSMKSSAPFIHVLGPNESGDFTAPLADPVSISASKRAVNSLLLSELLQQLKGWMRITSGIRSIPVMQLFYRLSSAATGPFTDSSTLGNLDLETLIKWFLDEFDLSKPFIAGSRSSFGEVAILVFMFFTLMLRNWHQPGNDGVPVKESAHDRNASQISSLVGSHSSVDSQEKKDFASQLLRASNSLRDQVFINYLMDILQQLVQVFKSPMVNFETASGLNPGSGCSTLLTVRRDLPAGNFSPFFSDSYGKTHRKDIFRDYYRLLLENAFRLLYTLVRPEKHDKMGEKEKIYKISSGKELKLDGYQDVFCSYINNHHTTFVRRYARRLFLHLCGSKTHYYSVRDSWQLSNEMKKLYKHVRKSGGFQNPVPYERSVKIVKCLSTMAEVAAARPRNWQKYCLKHGDVLPFLMNGVFYFGEESVIQTLKLINLAFYSGKEMVHPSRKADAGESGTGSSKSVAHSAETKKKKKGDDGNESGIDKTYLDMEAAADIFTHKNNDILVQFIDCFLLEWNSSSVRTEAKLVLYGVWHHGKYSFKEIVLRTLLQKVKDLPMYGQNITEYTELVTWLLGKNPEINPKQQGTELAESCLTPDVVRCLFETLHSQNELLANHPNSSIYNTLSGMVEFDGYYLESEPCVACSSPEVPYSRMKLESLKSEMKFTDNRIIVKCTGSYTIQTVTMNVHDARKSKSVKVLNLYYNNRPVADLSELKNNWSLWKRAKSCHLASNQTELKVEFSIPITACNFMIELDSFYENLQALSLEPLQCPRCSRPVTDKHGICSNCHENAYQCRQCRNINYENLDSFLCNECGYSKYGRFEFNFTAKPSFTFDDMENDDDMKRGLAAIESESENAHRRYQQLLGFKKPLIKIVSSIGENDIMDSQQKDSVQQMMVSLPGPSCKINRKIALLGVLYGEKCKAAFDSVSKSIQTLQGLRRVLMNYLHQKQSDTTTVTERLVISRSPNNCYGCASTFVTQCLDILHILSRNSNCKKQLVSAGILLELFENNIHQGPKAARVQARLVLCAFSEGDGNAVNQLNTLIQKKVTYCLEHHRSIDISLASREELLLLSEVCALSDEFWESRLRVVFQLLFSSIKVGVKHPSISEHIILPCLRIIAQACTPPKPETVDKEQVNGKPISATQADENNSNQSGSLTGGANGNKSATETVERNWDTSHKNQDIQLLTYSEWEKGASYLDFVRRQYKVSQAVKSSRQRSRPHKHDYLALKYALRWKHRAGKKPKNDSPAIELGTWVTELVLSSCSQSIRSEMCTLVNLLATQSSSRHFRLLNLLMSLLPATLAAGESAAEYFELFFQMIDADDACLFLTARGCLTTICKLITLEVGNIESLEKSLRIDISQGFILHKLIELLGKLLEVANIRSRFMHHNLLSEVLEALIVIRGLIVQKTKLISDCNKLLKDLLDGLLLESSENKRQFIRACISGLHIHGEERKDRNCLFILEQLCNLICPSKPESVYYLVLNKALTQEEFIRGSMTKNPYSSAEMGPLMRDVKNKICHQLDLLGLLEDDYGMELLVAGNIISLDLSIAQVYDQVWTKSNSQSGGISNSSPLSSSGTTSARDYPPMIVTYRLQGLDGEATEPMIKELEEDKEESQDPEVEFAIAGAVREYGGLEILLGMIQHLQDDFKSNQGQLMAVLNLLMHCCKIRENRQALLKLEALALLLETARRAFSVDAMEPAEGILLIVESLTLEANESDNIRVTNSLLTFTSQETGTGEEAKKIVLMFLERLCHPSGLKKSNKQQRNTEMVARILPYLTYGEPAAMEALIKHFNPFLQNWSEFDNLQKKHLENPKDDGISQAAAKQRFTVENFVRVSESLKTSSCGERLKDIILEEGITGVAVKHLRESFPAGFKSSTEWSSGLKLPSIPHILSLLRGLSMGHMATQRCIDEGGILPLLHAMEGVSGENQIGAKAENLLDTLSNKEGDGGGFLEEKVRALRHATRDEMRRRALRKRVELLQGLGMRQELDSEGGGRIVVARPLLEGLDDVEEEKNGLACMVCREGYSLRPTDLLGVYSYSKRVNLGIGTSGSARGECVYTTVSYFNIIHFQCHQEAKRADAALKNPKKEWEGATLRNNESLCNSLFPVRGPSVPPAQYVRYVDHYWDNLNALGRAEGSRLRLLTYDIVLMLARFATGASFSAECRGGGRESNSKFLPFMIQMARHFLEQGNPSQIRNMAKSVSTYINSVLDSKSSLTQGPQPSTGTEETVQFMMVNSLLSESYESWLKNRVTFLQRGIYHAYMQHTHGRIESGSDLLSIVHPMLVYTGLIQQLQQFLKTKRVVDVGLVSESENGSLESWEVVMREKLLNVKEMLRFSKELVSWIDDMNSASDLQEAFDVIGVLGDVLVEGVTSCEEFVRAAISAGK